MFGEDQFVVMLGGLHIEMASFKALGNWLDGSGWTDVLVQAEVAKSGTADSFLKASHITRTRHAHQVTAATLFILQKQAYDAYVEETATPPLEFDACSNSMLFPSLSTGVSRLNLSWPSSYLLSVFACQTSTFILTHSHNWCHGCQH